ncbi:MAG: transcription-repair coupling factor [Clostridiales bacterium]|nr:transcription-repair coupling factor [Clostridiales bacterium]
MRGQEAQLIQAVREGQPCSAFGLPSGAKLYLAALFKEFVLYVAPDYLAAKAAAAQISKLRGGDCPLIAAKDETVLSVRAAGGGTTERRMSALFALVSGGARAAVTYAEALLQKFPDPSDFIDNAVHIAGGAEIKPETLIRALASAGYRRVEMVEAAGQFACRGDILDVFAVNMDEPVRADFFGDFVESVKSFDRATGLSGRALAHADVCPCVDTFGEKRPECALPAYLPANSVVVFDGVKPITDTAAAHYKEYLNRLKALREYPAGAENRLFAPADALGFFDKGNFKRLNFDAFGGNAQLSDSPQSTVHSPQLKDGVPRANDRGHVRNDDKTNKPETVDCALCTVHCETPPDNPSQFSILNSQFHFRPSPAFRYQRDFSELAGDVKRWRLSGYTVVLAGRDKKLCEDIRGRLVECGMTLETLASPALPARAEGAFILPVELDGGFLFHDSKLAVIGTYDLVVRPKTVLKRRGGKDVFTEARVGDFVVHAVHGVGRCAGVAKLSGGFGTKDYVVVEYRGGDKLYVPIDQMGSLSRYSGSENAPPLNKIGGAEFARLKERVRASVKELAFDLLKLYGERDAAKGFRYADNDELIKAFEDSFPYDETDDQLKACEEIFADMKAGKVMDRLVCGDVGYGKTEVALRAAFKTVAEGRQVAFIAPTGILSNQHYNTAKARFEPFGVRVECLNRFRSAKEQAETVEKLKDGRADIVCGTHRVLSADVGFKSLGLLILDEEQRFGVGDKEKIKLLKKDVNVLTLTATPIPRTLHMSLTGIRDISVLSEPPDGRLPPRTYVAEYSDELLIDAANREFARGGQVFIVYNRVEKIFAYASAAAAALPAARIAVAHGQMNARELEDAVQSFYEGRSDVLISTTIIENGIDLPRANTLIVCGADRLGLAQLYQLRGRVGRSDRLAYAYFTYESGKLLTEGAYKRLETILEFTEFGSGFKIAARDLEIRGAGEVLGARQHGHIEKVGYDMYCKLLAEAVAEAGGKAAADEPDTKLESDLDAYIPDAYIGDDAGRMRLYQRIGALRALKEREKLLAELADVYGPPPLPVQNLVNSGLLRAFAARAGAAKAVLKRKEGRLEFDSFSRVTDKVSAAVAAFSHCCVLKADKSPVILFKPVSAGSVYENVTRFLIKLVS